MSRLCAFVDSTGLVCGKVLGHGFHARILGTRFTPETSACHDFVDRSPAPPEPAEVPAADPPTPVLWRVKLTLTHNYVLRGDDIIGEMESDELAALVVEAVNAKLQERK